MRQSGVPSPVRLEIPEPLAVSSVAMPDGAEIRLRRHGNPEAPLRLLVSHGNGFAIDGYWPFWSLLLDDYDVITYDLRNHGWNPVHREEEHDLRQFVDDLDRIADHVAYRFGERPVAGVFHSVSAVVALIHALEREWRWRALVLFDPPLTPSPGHPLYEEARDFEFLLAARAEKRRAVFSDPGELARGLARSFRRRPWKPGTHHLMARSMLRRDPEDGVWRLACPPSFESRIYRANGSLDICPLLSGIPGPVGFICADPNQDDAWSPATVNAAISKEHGHHYTFIRNATHMLQIEKPEACVEAVVRVLDEASTR